MNKSLIWEQVFKENLTIPIAMNNHYNSID